MFNIYNKTNRKTQSQRYKDRRFFILDIATPSIVLCIALLLSIFINYTKETQNQKDHVQLSLNHILEKSEVKIDSLPNLSNLMEKTGVFSNISYAEDGSHIYHNISILKDIEEIFEYIDSIFIFNQETEKITTSHETFDANQFFGTNYKYENYTYNYWKNFRFYSTSNYRILSPTVVNNINGSKNVVPFVIKKRIEPTSSMVFLIININLQKLVEVEYTDYLTPNTQIYILNKHTNDIFSSSGELMDNDFIPNDLCKKLLIGTKNTFTYKINGTKNIIAYYSSNDTVIGYTYFAIIPYKDIQKVLLPYLFTNLLLIVLFIAISLILAYKKGIDIYNPLKETLEILNNNNKGSILKNIKDAASASQETTKKFNTILPYMQERYLIDMLNSSESYVNEEISKILHENLNFPHNYFMVVIIGFNTLDDMFNTYTSLECENIKKGLFNIIKDMFSVEYCYSLPTSQDVFYVILNMPVQNETENIENSLNLINNFLEYDKDTISVITAKSAVYAGLEGLKKAHHEVTNKFSMLKSSNEKITLDFHSDETLDFNERDEDELFRSLISYNKDKTYASLERILAKHSDVSSYNLKKLYNHILNTVIRVMRIKKISTSENKLDFEIINECLTKQPEVAYLNMMMLINTVLDFGESSSFNDNSAEFVKFIEDNFQNPDISLKLMSEYFNTNNSTISVAIKKITGIGFHKFLTNLRVQHAKELLVSTDIKINDICELCGFNSIKTFYKIFKTETGMTALQYRNQNHK